MINDAQSVTNPISTELNEKDIEQAFEQDQFEICYQPQVSLSEQGKIIGAEAFVRLNHPVYGTLVPGVFIPLLIKMGLLMRLTETVVTKVAKQWCDWHEKGHDLQLSVNIDHVLFNDKALAKKLGSIFAETDLPKHRLTLEIAHWDEAGVSSVLREQVTRLRMKGFILALDNYGQSSLYEQELNELPIDEIKIHRDIVATLSAQSAAQTKVRKAMHIADRLGMRVVAVGVEGQQDADWLQRQGCDSAQGYLYGKPLIAKDFEAEVLSNSQAWHFASPSSRLKVLVLEDDDQHRNLLVEGLSDAYEVHAAASIAESEELFQAVKPELLVLDVNLPDGSGIDFCNHIKQHNDAENFSALFISGNETPELRIEAYEAGAVDFVVKPLSLTELMAKIGRLASYQLKRKQLATNATEFQSAAMQSMQEAAHYGDVVQFFKNLLHCRDERGLAQELFRFMSQKGLSCSVQFRGSEAISNFDQHETVCSPIEVNIFELLKDKGRLYDFKNRTIVNDEHVSFLVKNMPTEEAEHGRARDYVAVLIEGLEARFKDILRQRVLQSVFQQLQELAMELAAVLGQEATQSNELLDKFSLELRMSFHVLDMNEEQEEHIQKIVENMLKAKDDGEISTRDVGGRITEIVEVLSGAMRGLEEQAQAHAPVENGAEVIELF